MSSDSRFRTGKNAVGAYFNDGTTIMWSQVKKEFEKTPDDRLIKAVQAALTEFVRVFEETK